MVRSLKVGDVIHSIMKLKYKRCAKFGCPILQWKWKHCKGNKVLGVLSELRIIISLFFLSFFFSFLLYYMWSNHIRWPLIIRWSLTLIKCFWLMYCKGDKKKSMEMTFVFRTRIANSCSVKQNIAYKLKIFYLEMKWKR